MHIRVIDFETTGFPPDAGVIEIGFTDVRTYDSEPAEAGDAQAWLCHPGPEFMPIPPEAMAVHHIRESDLEFAPLTRDGFVRLADGAQIYCAHNAAFERQFFSGGNLAWICTFKCARRAWPDFSSFANQYLRYKLDLKLEDAQASPPHRAGPDTYVTAHILLRLLESYSVRQLVEWTEAPTFYPRVPMTKHKGALWSEVDFGLLKWFQSADVDEDIKAAARDEMDRRRK